MLRRRLMEAVRRRRGLVLLSDFDGTLAPIAAYPAAVRLPPRVRRLLAHLSRHPHIRLGIVSGRSLRDVKKVVGIAGAAYAGCHGLEVAWRGVRFRHPRAMASVPLLRRAAGELRRGTRRVRGVLVEWKGLTVSLHFRLADPRAVPALRFLVRRVASREAGLEILPGKKVLELRPRVAWGKGEAVRLLRNLLAKSLGPRPLTIYVGDDRTDEEAFRALQGRALCVAVGRRRTRAPFRLSGPAAVERLLGWLADAVVGADLRR